MRDGELDKVASQNERRRIRYLRDQHRNVWAIWTLILGGWLLTFMIIATALDLTMPV